MPNKKTLVAVTAIAVAIVGFLTTSAPAFVASEEKVLYSFKDDGATGWAPRQPAI